MDEASRRQEREGHLEPVDVDEVAQALARAHSREVLLKAVAVHSPPKVEALRVTALLGDHAVASDPVLQRVVTEIAKGRDAMEMMAMALSAYHEAEEARARVEQEAVARKRNGEAVVIVAPDERGKRFLQDRLRELVSGTPYEVDPPKIMSNLEWWTPGRPREDRGNGRRRVMLDEGLQTSDHHRRCIDNARDRSHGVVFDWNDA